MTRRNIFSALASLPLLKGVGQVEGTNRMMNSLTGLQPLQLRSSIGWAESTRNGITHLFKLYDTKTKKVVGNEGLGDSVVYIDVSGVYYE